MLLTLAEAAARLGQSERQVRYRITKGELRAEKRGGRWMVDSADLPVTGAARDRVHRRTAALRAAVEDVLPSGGDAAEPRRRYSLRNLRAFQIALPLLERTEVLLGADHPSVAALRAVLEHLSRGCHRFERTSKAESYLAARDAASDALLDLVLAARHHEDASALADAIEQDLMPAFAGLLRRVDRRRNWSP